MKPKKKPGSKRKKIFFVILFSPLILAILALIGWNWLTSPSFIKNKLLPELARELNAEITVEGLDFRPFNRFELSNLRLVGEGSIKRLEIDSLIAEYRLLRWFRGDIDVRKLEVAGVRGEIEHEATTRERPLKKDESSQYSVEFPELSGAEFDQLRRELPRLAVQNVSFKDVSLEIRTNDPDSGTSRYAMRDVSLSVPKIFTGDRVALTMAGEFERGTSAGDSLSATLSTPENGFSFTLPDAPSGKIDPSGAINLSIDQATGVFQETQGLVASLTLDTSDTVALTAALSQGTQRLSSISISGAMGPDAPERKIALDFQLDKNLLNLVAAGPDLRFGDTTISGSLQWIAGATPSDSNAQARLNAKTFSVTRQGKTTPKLDLNFAADLAIQPDAITLAADTFEFTAQSADQPLASLELKEAVTFQPSKPTLPEKLPPFILKVENLNIEQWAPLFAEDPQDLKGRFDGNLMVQPTESVERLMISGVAKSDNLNVSAEPTPLSNADIELAFQGTLNSANWTGDLALSGKLVSDGIRSMSWSGNYNAPSANENQADFTVTIAAKESAPETFKIALKSQLEGPGIAAIQSTLQAPTTPRADSNALTLNGRIPFASKDSGNLTIRAATLDIDPILRIAEALGTDDADSESENMETSAPDLSPLAGVGPTQISVQIDEVFYKQIQIQSLAAEGGLEKSILTLDPITLKLNGSNTTGSITLDATQPEPKLTTAFQSQGTPIAPFLQTFVNQRAGGVYTGALDLDFNFDGPFPTSAEIHQNANGTLSVSLSNSNLELSKFWEQNLLTPIATLLGLPSLIDAPIQAVDLKLNLSEGALEIANAMAQADAFRFKTWGSAQLEDGILKTLFNLPLSLAIDEAILQKAGLKFTKAAENTSKYIELPQFLALAGQLDSLKPVFDQTGVAKMLLQAKGALPETSSNELNAIADLIGDVISGNTNQVDFESIARERLQDIFSPPATEPDDSTESTDPNEPTNKEKPASNPANLFNDLLRGIQQ